MIVYCGQYQGKCIIKDTDDNALEFYTKTDLKKIFKSTQGLEIVGCKFNGKTLDLMPMPDKAFKSPLPFMVVEDGIIKRIDMHKYDLVRDGAVVDIRLSDYGWKLINDIRYYGSNGSGTIGTIVLRFDDNILYSFTDACRLFPSSTIKLILNTTELSDSP